MKEMSKLPLFSEEEEEEAKWAFELPGAEDLRVTANKFLRLLEFPLRSKGQHHCLP